MMGESNRRQVAILNGKVRACGNCDHFKRIEIGSPGGFCRGSTPVPICVGMGKHPITGQPQPVIMTYWPQVPDTERCGAWEEKVSLGDIDLTQLQAEQIEGTA